MPLEGEWVPGTSAWANEQTEIYEASGGAEGTTLRGVPVIVVTSRGAKSGALRKNPLMRVEHGGEYAAVASKGGHPASPAWYFNIVADPLVTVQDGTEVGDYRAREVDGEEYDTWWKRSVAVWPDYAEYQKKTDRKIPIFVLSPI